MQEFSRKYGVQTTLHFVLYEVDGVDFRVDAVDAGSDCNIMKDEGAETTCVNDFVDRGTGYSLVVTATEMEAAEILIYVVDSATKVWLDEPLKIETYGNASAMHAFDLDTASSAQTGDSYAVVNHGSHGNAQLVRSTTPANKLDVSGTGEAGLDFDNIKDATGAHTLTNITVPITTTNSDMVGTDGANTTTPPTVAQIQTRMETNGASILDTIRDLLPGSTIAAATDIPAMVGTNNAALASVVGALADGAAAGDPTTGETLMQYVKQLINTLEGAVGIPVFPAEAAPANNVSLAEAIRAIAIDVAGLNGSAMIGTNSAALATALATHDGKLDTAQTDLDTLTDARGEPGQGALPVSATSNSKLDYLYKCILRNKRTSDDDSEDFFADDTTTRDHTRSLSDDGSTFTKGEVGTGA